MTGRLRVMQVITGLGPGGAERVSVDPLPPSPQTVVTFEQARWSAEPDE